MATWERKVQEVEVEGNRTIDGKMKNGDPCFHVRLRLFQTEDDEL